MSYESQMMIIESLREEDAMREEENRESLELRIELNNAQRQFEAYAKQWEDDDWS